MKILYLITKGERGGAQSHLWELMRRQSLGVPLLALGEDGYLGEQARAAGYAVHRIAHLVHPVHPWRDLWALREIIDLIRAEKPSLLHGHTAKAGMLARLAGYLTGTPTVYTVHAWSFTSMRSPVLRSISVWLEKALSRLNQTIIDVSQANFTLAEKIAVAPRGRHLVIWNGVPDSPHRAYIPAAAERVEIIMVARFAPPKDHALLVEALAGLERNWRCTFVGSGPELGRVRALAAGLGLDDSVRFLGDRDDVAELLAQSHLFVLCSNSESLPISILEAMRAGLPVIATAVGGCAELVVDGETGVLIPPANADRLRACLHRLVGAPDLLRSMGRAGRARFQTHFRIEGMVDQTVAAYTRLLPAGLTGAALQS